MTAARAGDQLVLGNATSGFLKLLSHVCEEADSEPAAESINWHQDQYWNKIVQ